MLLMVSRKTHNLSCKPDKSFGTVYITVTSRLICFSLFNTQCRSRYIPEVTIDHVIFNASLDFQSA